MIDMKKYFENENIVLYHSDVIDALKEIPKNSVDMIFADPPYFLSNGGITCRAGKMVSVNKGDWDRSSGVEEDLNFNINWIKEARRVLKENGTIWISGTMHNIYQVGYALKKLKFKILNEIVWFKPNAPPNLSKKYFTHSHETVIWARKHSFISHKYNYEIMKEIEDKLNPKGKQLRGVWVIPLTPKREKVYGHHPTQKPLELLKRIILSSTTENDVILDPFVGSGTTAVIATKYKRKFIGIDKEKKYLDLTLKRLRIKQIKKEEYINKKK